MADPIGVLKAKLSAKQRDNLPASDFVFPADRRYPIGDLEHARKALQLSGGKPENAKVKAAVYRRYPELRPDKTDKAQPIEKAAPLAVDESQHLVYGVVLTPDLADSQDDTIVASDIEKAAHRWLSQYRKHDVQHAEVAKGADGEPICEVVESFIAPQHMEIAGEPVKKGAWVLAAHVNDPTTWTDVREGRLTGWSIGGTGVRDAT